MDPPPGLGTEEDVTWGLELTRQVRLTGMKQRRRRLGHGSLRRS